MSDATKNQPTGRYGVIDTHAHIVLEETFGAAGKYGNTLKIRPPLCFENSHADFFLNQMQRAIEETSPNFS